MERKRVFISHSSNDKKIVSEMADYIERVGMKVFLAHIDIEGGVKWKESLHKEITECDLLVALVTPNFYTSEYTCQEVGAAWVLNKPVLPVCKGAIPNGFIGERQGIQYDQEWTLNTAESILRFALREVYDDESMGNFLAKMLVDSESFNQSNALIQLLIRERNLTMEQLLIARKALQMNFEVQEAFKRPELEELLRKNEINC